MAKSILSGADVYGDPVAAVGPSAQSSVQADRPAGYGAVGFWLFMVGLLIALRIAYEAAGENV